MQTPAERCTAEPLLTVLRLACVPQHDPKSVQLVEGTRLGSARSGHYPEEAVDMRKGHTGTKDAAIHYIDLVANRGNNVNALRNMGQLYYW